MRKFIKLNRKFYIISFIILFIIILYFSKSYLKYINTVSSKVIANNNIEYVESNKILDQNGFLNTKIKENVLEYIKNKKVDNLTYKIEGEDLSLDLKIIKNGEDQSINLTKIIDKKHNVKAQINFNDIQNLQFRTGNNNSTTILKITTKYDCEYIAFIDDTYYFLGKDIKNLTYVDDQFYYITYNPNYKILENVTECTKEVINKIDGFNYKHYYYKYGKINFLKDFYQKLPTKAYTVKNRCDDIKEQSHKLDKQV